jgi:hypothetical protein
MKHGLGIFHLADGSVYEGGFENDQFHGYGTFVIDYLISDLA